MELARHCAEALPDMVGLWEVEVAAARARLEVHWAEVQRKQKRIADLSREVRQLEARELAADAEAAGYPYHHYLAHAARSESEDFRRRINSKSKEIERERPPPPPVLQPLPAARNQAMPVIFFLKMPRRFQALSRYSFMAQQMLLPGESKITIPAADQGRAVAEQSIDISTPIHREGPTTAWHAYYTSGSSGHGRTAESPLVSLGANVEVPRQIGGKDVTTYHSPNDGVWHPDTFDACLFWTGGARDAFALDSRGAYFNPFAPLPVAAVARWYTETLPADRRAMQWAMGASYGVPLLRGNEPIAFQQFRPAYLSKPEFLAFGALRAFPRQGFRKVCVALRERSLPLGDPAVRALLLQTLLHVGELSLSSDAAPRFEWRGDVEECDGWATLEVGLQSRAHGSWSRVRVYGHTARCLLLPPTQPPPTQGVF